MKAHPTIHCGPKTATFIVDAALSGVRIDSFLGKHLRNYTPFRLQRMIDSGFASVDSRIAELRERVFRKSWISLKLVEPPDKLFPPDRRELDVIYEDPWLIVLNKPAGLVTHPVGEFQDRTLANVLQAYLDTQTSMPGLQRPGIVHRLDRMTSGVIVTTKDHLSHSRLSIQFQRNLVRKSYMAVVEGCPAADAGVINLPIGRATEVETVLMSTSPTARRPKPACTEYEVVQRSPDRALIRAFPLTGRVHQIRIHLASLGHPVWGDEFYGRFGMLKPTRDANESARHALHAESISFRHPVTHVPLRFHAPLPSDIRQVCDTRRQTHCDSRIGRPAAETSS